jgi:putative salt-induced outer membrane protein YdiY
MKHSSLIHGLIGIVAASVGTVSLYAQDAAATPPAPAALIATNAPPPKPKPKWESTLTASLSLTRGNSETLTASGAAATQKKWDKNEIKLGIDGTYGEITQGTNTTVNPNMFHGFGQYNRLFSERLFGYARAEGLHDEVADIKYRVSVSPGGGYYFIKNKTTDLDLELGPGFIWQDQGGVVDNYATLRVGDNFNHKFSDRAKFWQKTEVLPKVANFAYVIVSSEIGVSATLTEDKKLALTVTLNHTYNSQPAAGRLRNDTILKTGITYAF